MVLRRSMKNTLYLFEPESVAADPPAARPSVPKEVRRALANLKKALDDIPAEEWELRRRRWEYVEGGLLGVTTLPRTARRAS